jgi:hypothetical protein
MGKQWISFSRGVGFPNSNHYKFYLEGILKIQHRSYVEYSTDDTFLLSTLIPVTGDTLSSKAMH